ncbi:hypothetical protein GCM10009846_15510 [Agrococcus versicolor]|uniref:Uncharacterized protein n=1 Tax=Agrococcus versicolor TaxID=501482 RepID=A0ABP5MFU7_9MICO
MRWPRGRRDADDAAPPPTDDELGVQVDEGLLIVITGLRLSARNRVVLDVLRDRADVTEASLAAAVRADALALAEEQRAGIERIQRIRDRAAGRRGQALHGADYRRGDVAPLELRARIAELLAQRLEALADDDDAVSAIVVAARRSAMDDMFDASLRRLHEAPAIADPEHDDRLAELHDLLRGLADDLDAGVVGPR